jgi:hypothetical protein
MSRVLVVALALVAITAFCGTRTALGDDRVTWAEVESWARQDARTYGLSGDYLVDILRCESGGTPYARGALGEVGPAQFLPYGGIWQSTPYAGEWPLDYSRWSLRAQVYAFAWSMAEGYGSHWSCS